MKAQPKWLQQDLGHIVIPVHPYRTMLFTAYYLSYFISSACEQIVSYRTDASTVNRCSVRLVVLRYIEAQDAHQLQQRASVITCWLVLSNLFINYDSVTAAGRRSVKNRYPSQSTPEHKATDAASTINTYHWCGMLLLAGWLYKDAFEASGYKRKCQRCSIPKTTSIVYY